MLKLIHIEKNIDISNITEETTKAHVELTMDYYEKVGFIKPWISYLVDYQSENVGICAFKGKPVDNSVEIAYSTFPPYEGRGFATKACGQLIGIAQRESKDIRIAARTLPEDNASTTVLKKNGFRLSGTAADPDDGEVFEWVL
jgi:RimJ/RimL family protein N-acetyltransferase